MKRINIFTVQLVRESAKLYDLDNAVIKSPYCAYDIIEKVLNLSDKTKEHFGMLSLTTKNKVVGVHVISIGSLNATVVHPREIFQQAILNNSASIIVFHNHPSGVTVPSPEDIDFTSRLIEAGQIIGIEVLDHLIIGDYKFISLKEKGYM